MPESEIIFTHQLKTELLDFLNRKQYSSVGMLVDENTKQHCLSLLALASYHLIEIESGEQNKTLRTCEKIWEEMTRMQMDRKAVMINLGGGVIGDMGGFCAATYKRGIDFIQIPTTLLSQVDASVGGKLGIDFLNFKNHIGVFENPQAVFIHSPFLLSLPAEELRSGFAEIIKHCLIADKKKWDEIRHKSLEDQDWENLALHSVEIKSKITRTDPTEQGLRKILNFGHTIGHAIESHFLNIPGKRLLHGEAVAAGIVCEAFLAMKKNFLKEKEVEQISEYIFRIFGTVEIFDFDLEKILPLALQDKKNDRNIIQCSLLKHIGEANFNIPVTLKDIRESILFYNLKHASAKNGLY